MKSFCASTSERYPQSIIDDISDIDMSKATESKTPNAALLKEARELLKIGSLDFTPRQFLILHNPTCPAERDDLRQEEKDAFGESPEVSVEEVESTYQLAKNESAPAAKKTKVEFSNDCQELLLPVPKGIKRTFRQIESATPSMLEAVPVVLISDPGQDLDDEMMFIMSSYMQSLGMISIRGVIATLYPSLARARLTRGTFNLLGLPDVPVGIGTDGGDTSGMHSSEHFESTASSYIIREDDEAAIRGLENGYRLLHRIYKAASHAKCVGAVEGGINGNATKKVIKGGLTIVVTSSLKDISIFARENPNLFASKTREVVIMGGCHPVSDEGDECKPDLAHNNAFDPEASARFYSQCQRANITLTVVARHSARAARMPRSIYDDLAGTGSVIGKRLRDSQRAGIEQLWRRACASDPVARKGLPERCGRRWFVDTFCGGKEPRPGRSSGADSVWDAVTGFLQYDTLALVASVPVLREAYFDPIVLPPLGQKGGVVNAFDAGTRNLIGISEGEHNIKDPVSLVRLLNTGYRQGLMCNHISS